MCLWFYCAAWITEQQLLLSLYSVTLELKVLATGWHILDKGKGRWDWWGLHRPPTKEEIGGHGGGMSSEWYPHSGMAGKGEKGMSSGILELSKNESTNSFKHGWEETTWEEKQQQLRHSPEQPRLQEHRAVLRGIGQHATALSRGVGVTEAASAARAPHKGTECAKLCLEPLSTAELSHGKHENSTHSHRSAKCLTKLASPLSFSKFSFHKVEHHVPHQWGPTS